VPAEAEASADESSKDEISEDEPKFAAALPAIVSFTKLPVKAGVDELETGTICDGGLPTATSAGTPPLKALDVSGGKGPEVVAGCCEPRVVGFMLRISEPDTAGELEFRWGSSAALRCDCGEVEMPGAGEIARCMSVPTGLLASAGNDAARFGAALTSPAAGIESSAAEGGIRRATDDPC
jgi:hypothetical protein